MDTYNKRLRSAGIQYILEHCSPNLVIAQTAYYEIVHTAYGKLGYPNVPLKLEDLPHIETENNFLPRKPVVKPDQLLSIIYTSGTTGPPKGVLITHRMLRVASEAALIAAGIRPGDRLFSWEPLCHIGGIQMLIAPFIAVIQLQLVERFSASSFWEQAQRTKATHLHYLGGILDILLQKSQNSTSPQKQY